MNRLDNSDYSDVSICNIRRGKGSRRHIIYAQLINSKGEILISASLYYIHDALMARMPREKDSP